MIGRLPRIGGPPACSCLCIMMCARTHLLSFFLLPLCLFRETSLALSLSLCSIIRCVSSAPLLRSVSLENVERRATLISDRLGPTAHMHSRLGLHVASLACDRM